MALFKKLMPQIETFNMAIVIQEIIQGLREYNSSIHIHPIYPWDDPVTGYECIYTQDDRDNGRIIFLVIKPLQVETHETVGAFNHNKVSKRTLQETFLVRIDKDVSHLSVQGTEGSWITKTITANNAKAIIRAIVG